MKVIILSAGKGKRLHHLTMNKPKSLVGIYDKSLIDYLIKVFLINKCKKIYLSTGYKSYCFNNYPFKKIYNRAYNSTNMVYTLVNTLKNISHDEDVVVSYGDILFNKKILKKVINTHNDFSVVVDEQFIKLWKKRYINPIKDLETLKMNKNTIYEIGGIPQSLKDIDAQYLGLIKLSKNFIKKFINFYDNFKNINPTFEKNLEKISMTEFINLMIKNNFTITPLMIQGGWLEIDTELDLKKYKYYNLVNKIISN